MHKSTVALEWMVLVLLGQNEWLLIVQNVLLLTTSSYGIIQIF